MTDLMVNEISIELIENDSGLLGFTNFVINNDFKICNVAIHSCLKSPVGIRLVFPTKEYKGTQLKTVYPIHQASYEAIAVAVSNAYEELMIKLR
ncbi:MAG: hypothetical protein ABIH85_07305 [Candidatus Omnitrophota bacterium]